MKARASESDWQASLEVPSDGWIDIDLDVADVRGWARSAAATHLGDNAEPGASDSLADELCWYNTEARNREAVLAHAYAPGDSAVVGAFLHVLAIPCGPEERSLDAVMDALRSGRGPGKSGPDLSVVTLPAGPACRLREMALGRADEGQADVMEYASYFVIPGALDYGIVEVTLTWNSVGVAETFQQVAAEIAETLVVQPSSSP